MIKESKSSVFLLEQKSVHPVKTSFQTDPLRTPSSWAKVFEQLMLWLFVFSHPSLGWKRDPFPSFPQATSSFCIREPSLESPSLGQKWNIWRMENTRRMGCQLIGNMLSGRQWDEKACSLSLCLTLGLGTLWWTLRNTRCWTLPCFFSFCLSIMHSSLLDACRTIEGHEEKRQKGNFWTPKCSNYISSLCFTHICINIHEFQKANTYICRQYEPQGDNTL